MTSKAEIRAAYQEGLKNLPRHMHDGVTAYIEHGQEVGGFLTAMLEGDFVGGRFTADHLNVGHWEEWIAFLRDSLAPVCHGSPLKVAAWRKMGGLDGYPEGDT